MHVVSYYSASREALDIIRAGRKKNSTDDSVKSGKADSSDATVDGLNHSIENLSIEGLDQGNASGKGPVSSSTEWVPLLERFWFGDDTFRNNRFKMIPIIVKGAWSIKTAVGQKPALTGTKLTQKYFLGPNYLEVDIDISSSTVANTILGMVSLLFVYLFNMNCYRF